MIRKLATVKSSKKYGRRWMRRSLVKGLSIRLTVDGWQLPVHGCRLPVAGCRWTVAGWQLPVADGVPAILFTLLGTIMHRVVQGEKAATFLARNPVGNWQPATGNRQLATTLHSPPMILTHTSDHITTITLNRPEKLNAFSGTMREDLLAALRAAEVDDASRVVVLTGAGRAFCAGGDVAFMSGLQKSKDIASFRRLLDAGKNIVMQIAEMSKPVIASVNGIAAGAGCNLA